MVFVCSLPPYLPSVGYQFYKRSSLLYSMLLWHFCAMGHGLKREMFEKHTWHGCSVLVPPPYTFFHHGTISPYFFLQIMALAPPSASSLHLHASLISTNCFTLLPMLEIDCQFVRPPVFRHHAPNRDCLRPLLLLAFLPSASDSWSLLAMTPSPHHLLSDSRSLNRPRPMVRH